VQPLWKTTWSFLKKLKAELPYDLSVSLLSTYLKKCNSKYNRDTCIPMFIAALFIIAKLCNQSTCPSTNEWIKRKWYIYTQWVIIQP
jgi:hypothetical protein